MKNIFKTIVLFAAIICLMSCEKDFNDWGVEPGHDRLFKSLVFEVVEVGATDVEIRYTKSVSADKYLFEFSKDSLQFSNIVKTVEVLADTLTPFANSTTATRVEYRTIFDDLDGTTGYSVRMKGVDTLTNKASGYSQFYFKTGEEQLFTEWNTFTDRIQMLWIPTDRVTKITVINPATGEVVQERVLTAVEKANASAVLENLDSGTTYQITIYNNDVVRGVKTLKTSGLEGGVIISVHPGDVVPDLISGAVAQGKSNITLLFDGGQTYDLATLTIPAGVSNLSFTGKPAQAGALPKLNILEVKLSDLIYGQLLFENIELLGDIGKYLFSLGTDNLQVGQFNFKGCRIANYRSLVRLGNNQMDMNKVLFDNCLINNIGGYGVVNVGGGNVQLDSIVFQNSTLTELSTQLMDVRTAVPYIYIGNCTFYNVTNALSQLLRFDTNALPLSVQTEANILAGNNAGAKINSLSFDMTTTGLNVSFGGSYITNELIINRYDFASITLFNGSSNDLFVDPGNKNFAVKPESGFGGRGTAGDPRWW
ncbi:DUF5123 domain-containing protein [Pontibacter beigongshangensis]|uniref:DUF5123 domain-containing protein n=1 Tax=Pontibacter beigongshangensis TaxID=2574733 RepID=UPI00164F68DE|nr:DUF5123 domain-containing protein [Pontibacter beigongshangensis]